MTYKKSLINILEPVIAGMVFPMRINKVINTGSLYTLFVCDIFHAQVGFTVSISGNDYEITDIDADGNTITVNGTVAITAGTTFNLYEPFFFHGTPYETNTELAQESNSFNKTPMVWLLETYQEVFHDDPEDTHDREAAIRLFFLTQSDFSKISQQLHDDYLEPMKRLMENFIKAIDFNTELFEKWDFDFTVIRHSKFGVYINNKGYDKNFFADNLSGIELQCTLKILKAADCGCTTDGAYLIDEDGLLINSENDGLLMTN